jgi:hypothetical protein
VIDRLVEIHSLDPILSHNQSKAQMKRKIEKWRAKGETWFEIIHRYNAGILVLIPPEVADIQ